MKSVPISTLKCQVDPQVVHEGVIVKKARIPTYPSLSSGYSVLLSKTFKEQKEGNPAQIFFK